LIEVHNDAVEDLREIRASDPKSFGKLYALIEQLRADPLLAPKLIEHDFGADRAAPVSVMQWHRAWKVEKVPLWRLKFWDLEKSGVRYRLLYIYDWRARTHYIMGVVARAKFDYDDPNDPIKLRVVRRCRQEFPGL
jgi:hypothetical protein